MTLNELIDSVQRAIQDPDGTRWTPEEITAYLNDGQRDLNLKSGILRSMKVMSLATLNLPGDSATAYYVVPSDVIQILRVENAGFELMRIGLPEFGASLTDWTQEQGLVDSYLYGPYGPLLLRLYRDPGVTLTALRLYYLRNAQDLGVTQTPEIPDAYHRALGFYATARCYLKDFEYKNPDKAAAFQQMYESNVQDAVNHAYKGPRQQFNVYSF